MKSEMKGRQFSHTLRGYDPEEVDAYILNLQNYCSTLSNQVLSLETKLKTYESQEQQLKSTLQAAEKTAQTIIENAKYSAKNIQTQTEKKALSIIAGAEQEANQYRNNVYKNFEGYEQELKKVLVRLNNISCRHMENLQKEFNEEMKKTTMCFEDEYSKIPHITQIKSDINI